MCFHLKWSSIRRGNLFLISGKKDVDYFKVSHNLYRGRKMYFTLCLFHRGVYQLVDNLSSREKVTGSNPVTDVDLG